MQAPPPETATPLGTQPSSPSRHLVPGDPASPPPSPPQTQTLPLEAHACPSGTEANTQSPRPATPASKPAPEDPDPRSGTQNRPKHSVGLPTVGTQSPPLPGCTQDPTPGDPIHCPLRPHVLQPATILETLGRLRRHLERTAGLLFGQGLGHHVQVSWQQRQVGRDTELNGDWGDQEMGACDRVTGGTLRPRCGCSQDGSQVWTGLPSRLTPQGQRRLREDFRDGGRKEQMLAWRISNSTACRARRGAIE